MKITHENVRDAIDHDPEHVEYPMRPWDREYAVGLTIEHDTLRNVLLLVLVCAVAVVVA